MFVSPRLRRLVGCAAVGVGLVTGGCSGEADDGGGAAPSVPEPSASAAEPVAEAPVMGASQVLVPDPTGDGVLLLTAPPEEVVDDGPITLWRWDGQTWTALEPEGPTPEARSYFAATYDADREVVVLYGGMTATGTSDATWEWDGASWRRFDVPGPPGEMSAVLVHDPSSRTDVLYGGNEEVGEQHGSSWSWDGSSWTRLAQRGPRPVRWPAATAANPADRSVVLYGGHQVVDEAAPPALGDTWVWTGGAWARRPDAAGPGALVNAQAITHPQLGVLLVGGSGLNRDRGDVWHWDGDRWLLMARGVFPPRQAFGLAYDAARDTIVLTGGLVEPGSLQRYQDVWEWSGNPNDGAVQVDARPPA